MRTFLFALLIFCTTPALAEGLFVAGHYLNATPEKPLHPQDAVAGEVIVLTLDDHKGCKIIAYADSPAAGRVKIRPLSVACDTPSGYMEHNVEGALGAANATVADMQTLASRQFVVIKTVNLY